MTTLSEYQKNVLSELGITQWISRAHAQVEDVQTQQRSVEPELSTKSNSVSNKDFALAKLAALKQSEQSVNAENQLPISAQPPSQADKIVTEPEHPVLIDLTQPHPLVQDVLTYLCLAGNIDDKTQLSLNWVEGDSVSLEGNTLNTPSLAELAQSADYKKQLWQALQTWTV